MFEAALSASANAYFEEDAPEEASVSDKWRHRLLSRV